MTAKPNSTATAMAVASRLANALDAEDYATAQSLLAPDCTYLTGSGATLHGSAAVVASYREAGDWVRAHVQHHGYEHLVRPGLAGDDRCAIATFIDHLRMCDVAHTYRCEQRLWVGNAGTVERIEHAELPGERERLAAWMRQVGLDRAR